MSNWWSQRHEPHRWFGSGRLAPIPSSGAPTLSVGDEVIVEVWEAIVGRFEHASNASVRVETHSEALAYATVDIVVASSALVAEDRSIIAWLLGHELVHIVDQHHRRRQRFRLGVVVAAVLGCVAAVYWLPRGAGVSGAFALVAISYLVDAWHARALERFADTSAAAALGRPDLRLLVDFFERCSTKLYPGRIERLLAPHLYPAERMTVMEKFDRSTLF